MNIYVTLREGRVSRNEERRLAEKELFEVTLREGRVSRNEGAFLDAEKTVGHAPRGACE